MGSILTNTFSQGLGMDKVAKLGGGALSFWQCMILIPKLFKLYAKWVCHNEFNERKELTFSTVYIGIYRCVLQVRTWYGLDPHVGTDLPLAS
jgi:hypothetical protein